MQKKLSSKKIVHQIGKEQNEFHSIFMIFSNTQKSLASYWHGFLNLEIETITHYYFLFSVSWPNWLHQIQTCLPMLNPSSSSSWPVHHCSVWMRNPGFFWPRQVSIGNSLTNLIWLLKSRMLEVLVPDQIFSLKSVMKMTTPASPDKSKLSSRISRAHFQVIIEFMTSNYQSWIYESWGFFSRNFLLILICSELILTKKFEGTFPGTTHFFSHKLLSFILFTVSNNQFWILNFLIFSAFWKKCK